MLSGFELYPRWVPLSIKKFFYLLDYLPGMFLTTCFAWRMKFLEFTGARASERSFKFIKVV